MLNRLIISSCSAIDGTLLRKWYCRKTFRAATFQAEVGVPLRSSLNSPGEGPKCDIFTESFAAWYSLKQRTSRHRGRNLISALAVVLRVRSYVESPPKKRVCILRRTVALCGIRLPQAASFYCWNMPPVSLCSCTGMVWGVREVSFSCLARCRLVRRDIGIHAGHLSKLKPDVSALPLLLTTCWLCARGLPCPLDIDFL